jgi:threonine/homoserine/homoserine lactone efflux protein
MVAIGTVLQASVGALTLRNWIGGAYLVWLGIQLWRASHPATCRRVPARRQCCCAGMFVAAGAALAMTE